MFKNIIFTSAYCGKYTRHFCSDIQLLTTFFREEFFIFGDFNAKHPSWNNSSNNRAGIDLFQLQNESNFFIHNPNSPTYISPSGSNSSTLDIFLSNSNALISEVIPLVELYSDHYPVLSIIHFNSIRRYDCKIFNFKAANWNNFKSYIVDKIDLFDDFSIDTASPESIDLSINAIIKLIIDARNFSVPLITKRVQNFQISSTCKSLIAFRNSLKRRFQRCDSNSRNLFKSLMNQCNFLINRHISIKRNSDWNITLSKLSTGCKSFGSLINVFVANLVGTFPLSSIIIVPFQRILIKLILSLIGFQNHFSLPLVITAV